MRYVALLRGVNLGVVRFAMRDLATALDAVGYGDVRTVLASGNVLLTSDDEATAVARGVAAVIDERFGFDVAVLVTDLPSVRAAVEAYPFPRTVDRHAYVVFGEAPAALDELVASAEPLDPEVEQVAAGPGVLFWTVPKGATLRSGFGTLYGRRQRSGAVTTRNLNTLEKILAAP